MAKPKREHVDITTEPQTPADNQSWLDGAQPVDTSAPPLLDGEGTSAATAEAPAEPKESDADRTARLKSAVISAQSNEEAAAANLADAKNKTAAAEHALCEHLKAMLGGKLVGVEVELGGVKHKPKLFKDTGRYRLDRVLQHERVTV